MLFTIVILVWLAVATIVIAIRCQGLDAVQKIQSFIDLILLITIYLSGLFIVPPFIEITLAPQSTLLIEGWNLWLSLISGIVLVIASTVNVILRHFVPLFRGV